MMCSEYQIKANIKELASEFGAKIENLSKNDSWESRTKMSRPAPVLASKDGKIKLNELIFPVNPFPNSRLSQSESNKKKTTKLDGDDQIIRIYDIPLWKNSFDKFPCVVPMTSFFEPAYWGEEKGNIVEFADPKEKFLFVPAIIVKPKVPATGKANGFSLLTHTASEQMLKFHHRLLVLLKAESAFEYLNMNDATPQERYDYLIDNRYIPKFKTSIDRKMAKGWEKRIEHHEISLKDELTYFAILKKEGVKG